MPFMSSPVAYPPTSSPAEESPRKKRKTQEMREPLQTVAVNVRPKVIGGFLADDSEEEDDSNVLKVQGGIEYGDGRLGSSANGYGLEREDGIGENQPKTTDINMPQANSQFVRPSNPPRPSLKTALTARSCSGSILRVPRKAKREQISYEQIVAARSNAAPGRARREYYGVDIHCLIESASKCLEVSSRPSNEDRPETTPQSIERAAVAQPHKPSKKLMWTEKYRARKFTDLVGDERTHRAVLKWLKGWDPVVFPGTAKPKAKLHKENGEAFPEREHRRILLLTGPPGLGKTTLAHVCAKQAGYEVQEINASDERSAAVVKGRIKDMVATENVRPVGIKASGRARKAARPVCVVVDEVDGVVSGSGGGGEGGFIKALVDLLVLDQKNSQPRGAPTEPNRRRRGDNFRMLRPLILICNDVYHPSLRILRQGSNAEIVHVRKPPLNMIVPRLQSIFEKEGVPCDSDGVRQLCEACWGVANRKEDRSSSGSGEGDMRGILVVGEWVASKFRAGMEESARLSRGWLEENVLNDLAYGGGAARNLGRGGSRDVVDKVFKFNAGFPTKGSIAGQPKSLDGNGLEPLTLGENGKIQAVERLRHMIESSGEEDRIISDCFTAYPAHPFQDDTFLSKPNAAYDWFHFHDTVSHAVHSAQEWDLASYQSHPILALHHLFASGSRPSYSAASGADDDPTAAEPHPFTGPRAAYAALEAEKAHRASLLAVQSALSLRLRRAFRSVEAIAMELVPYALRMLGPDVKPVVVGGSEKGTASVRRAAEKEMLCRSVECMIACGVRFERSRVEVEDGVGGAATAASWVYRMEPPLDALGVFETAAGAAADGGRVRYAVRQVLQQEWVKGTVLREQEARMRRGRGGLDLDEDDAVPAAPQRGNQATRAYGLERQLSNAREAAGPAAAAVKRDFFGRLLVATPTVHVDSQTPQSNKRRKTGQEDTSEADRVWVTYHEGYSNAVRKGITLKELLDSC